MADEEDENGKLRARVAALETEIEHLTDELSEVRATSTHRDFVWDVHDEHERWADLLEDFRSGIRDAEEVLVGTVGL